LREREVKKERKKIEWWGNSREPLKVEDEEMLWKT
jgi:hypothetical protein